MRPLRRERPQGPGEWGGMAWGMKGERIWALKPCEDGGLGGQQARRHFRQGEDREAVLD